MPARRDMLTGRLTFLHRSWGPLEPFDNAFPELLHQAGRLQPPVTDHFHYWEDGGATYHNRYDSYEFVRGQEGDPWKAMVQPHWERLREKYHARQFTDGAARVLLAEHHQPRVHQGGEGLPVRPVLRARLRVPRAQPGRRQLAAADRDLRSARALPRAGALQGAVRDGLERADPRLAALRPRRRTAGGMRGAARQLLRRRLDVRLPARPAPRLFRRARPVEGHGARRHDRSRLPARRARFLGEEPDEPLRGDRPHPALRPRSAATPSRRDPLRRARRSRSTSRRPSSTSSACRRAPEMEGRSLLPMSTQGERPRGRTFRLFRRRRERHRRALHLPPLSRPTSRPQEIYQYTLMPTHIFEPFSPEELRRRACAEPFPFTKGAKLLKVPVIERSPMYYKSTGPARSSRATRGSTTSRPIPARRRRSTIARSRRGWNGLMVAAHDGQPGAARGLRAGSSSTRRPHSVRGDSTAASEPARCAVSSATFASSRASGASCSTTVPERGVRALAFSTGGGLDFWVLVRPLARHRPALVRGMPVAWQSADRLPEPDACTTLRRMRARGFNRSFSGFLVTCGLDHIRQPAGRPSAARPLPVHAGAAAWPMARTGSGPSRSCSARARSSRHATAASALRLRRRIEAPIGGREIRIDDAVENLGAESARMRCSITSISAIRRSRQVRWSASETRCSPARS